MPVQAVLFGAGCGALTVAAAAGLARGTRGSRLFGALAGVVDAAMITTAAFYLHTTRVGKFQVWQRVLGELALRGDETVLDLGCGRGALLVAAAKLLPRGRAIGVDIWRADQTANSPAHTLSNAAAENVVDRVEVHTADITDLPFDADSFDLVVSNAVIHNVSSAAGRRRAIDEAARVLRPGGRLAIADLRATRQYAEQLREMGWAWMVKLWPAAMSVGGCGGAVRGCPLT
jgi:arsenite methyltransferase